MSRIYNIEGVEYPSVTTILDTLAKGDGILNWAVNCAMDYIRVNEKAGFDLDHLLRNAADNWRVMLDEAAGIGTEVHDIIQEYIATGRQNIENRREKVQQSFAAFLKWQYEHAITWIKSEMQVVSHTYGYAGTLDAICIYEGRKYVIDFKTSSGFWDSYRLQIAAYRHAAEEGGHKTEGTGILRLDKKTGQPEFKDYSERYERDLKAFLKLTDLYYLLKDRRLKNNPHVLEKEKPCRKTTLAIGEANG